MVFIAASVSSPKSSSTESSSSRWTVPVEAAAVSAPRNTERSAGDEEANFYKNGMKIKTSEGIMD